MNITVSPHINAKSFRQMNFLIEYAGRMDGSLRGVYQSQPPLLRVMSLVDGEASRSASGETDVLLTHLLS